MQELDRGESSIGASHNRNKSPCLHRRGVEQSNSRTSISLALALALAHQQRHHHQKTTPDQGKYSVAPGYLRLIFLSKTVPKNPLSRLVPTLDVEPLRNLPAPRSLRHILIDVRLLGVVPGGGVARSSGELAELREALDGGASGEGSNIVEPVAEPEPEPTTELLSVLIPTLRWRPFASFPSSLSLEAVSKSRESRSETSTCG